MKRKMAKKGVPHFLPVKYALDERVEEAVVTAILDPSHGYRENHVKTTVHKKKAHIYFIVCAEIKHNREMSVMGGSLKYCVTSHSSRNIQCVSQLVHCYNAFLDQENVP